MMAAHGRVLVLITLVSLAVWDTNLAKEKEDKQARTVTYDGRSLIINGKRELLHGGAIHYPRSPPQMWPELLEKAKHGGLSVIQTYVFWNIHEPVQGKYNFKGQYDLIKFLKLIHEKGMYVNLRIGPFIQGEWNHGGFPYWLREVPNITFRSDNYPFKYHMERYVHMIINKVKEAKLFYPQGGPIIMAQIENEYNHVQLAYRELGDSYVQWAAKLAVSLDLGIPWVMCKQKDAPDPVINACNGRHCGDTFSGPNKPYKPFVWTENWTAQYRVWGDPPSQRAAEDIAFAVARFFSKNGSYNSYYMYYGGTNFDRTSSVFSTTRYYDEAPLDEFGLQRDPKWSHLKDLHEAIKLCQKALLWGNPTVQRLSKHHEIRVYEKVGSHVCASFLTNNHSKMATTIKFKGQSYFLPPRSISILPDCKTVVLNTQMIVAQHNSRNFVSHTKGGDLEWEIYSETIPTVQQVPVNDKFPHELYRLLKDTTDYGWYTTSINLGPRDLPFKKNTQPVLRVNSLGHVMHAFVNGEYIGSEHGSHEEKDFVLQKPVTFKPGRNYITLLGILVGLPDSGAYMEHRFAGPHSITILGLTTGTIDLSVNGWGHQVGLNGEKLGIFTQEGEQKVQWKKMAGPPPPLTWYKTTFDAPPGDDPVAIRMQGMGKGMIWVNGRSIGRHWMSFLSPLKRPTQSEYHIPRAFLKPKDNVLVIFEEERASPQKVEFLSVNRDTICSYISENYPPYVRSWKREDSYIKEVADDGNARPKSYLYCPNHKKIVAIEFADFGDPYGPCGNYAVGNCTSNDTKDIVEKECLGKNKCAIPLDRQIFDKKGDACPGIVKTLAVQAKCGH